MSTEQTALQTLLAKDAIRELAMLYSRGVDRKDVELLKTLYTKDGTDYHADRFRGSADDYIKFLERSLPHMRMSSHNICNHLISVRGDEADGEVYAVAFHVIPDGKGGFAEDFMCVRYIDRYRKEADGRWRFVTRVVTFDHHTVRPLTSVDPPAPAGDCPSYTTLTHRLFARGARA